MILLTGATGLLGSRLLFDLAAAGQYIRALRRTESRMGCVDHYFNDYPGLRNQVEWVPGDVTDLFSVEDALEGVSAVYHCAGKVSFQPSDRWKLHQVNIRGTANLVNACLDKGVSKLCFVSSVAAIGRSIDGSGIDENSTWKTSPLNSAYAISKYGAEREVWRGVAEGLGAVIVNPGIIIGPGNWKTDSSVLFSRVDRGLRFYTSGINGFVDVRDVSMAMIRLMESPVINERFILVSGNCPYRDVMDRISDKLGRKRPDIYAGPLLTGLAWRAEVLKSLFTGSRPVITRETARSSGKKFYYSNNKIRETLGIEFIPIMQSIDETAEVYLKKQAATENQ